MVTDETRGKVRAQLQISDFGIEEAALGVGIDADHGAIVLRVHGFGDLLLAPHAAFDICLRLIGSIHRLRFEVRNNALARNGLREHQEVLEQLHRLNVASRR
jgi:hypothetical protein